MRIRVAALLLVTGCGRPLPAPAIAPVPELAIVHGCVRDERGYALPGVVVEVRPLEVRTVTNETGCYVLRSPRFGPGEIAMVHIGRVPYHAPIELRAGTVLRREARLPARPIYLEH